MLLFICIFNCLLKLCARWLCNVICFIFLAFLHCAFSYVSSSGLHKKMHSHIGCMCLIFLHCVFSKVSLNCWLERMQTHIGCICLPFLHCVFSNVSSKRLHKRMQNHIGCICLAFLHCGFQMSPQFACLIGCIITLVAFV